jgi:dihydrofolate synthase/folylpolyglutamate synthase
LPEIAFEKAGIIKPCVPVVIGESHPETDSVFERKVLYTNLPEPKFMGDRNAIMSLLTFADQIEPTLWGEHKEILAAMDLQGEYQCKNLRTALVALDVLHAQCPETKDALVHTAARTGFRGRWEKISDNPLSICDIGHNEHGLKYNFAQLERMKASGEVTHLIIVYGSVADKDVDAGWKCLENASSKTIVFICESLNANSDFEFSNNFGKMMAEKPLNMPMIRDYLVRNKKYMQNRMLKYVVENINLF